MPMHKRRVYVETSVVSYLVAEPSQDVLILGRQKATRELWSRLSRDYAPYVSVLVVQEAGKGNAKQSSKRAAAIASFPVLDINDTAEALSAKILHGKGIPDSHPEDALHIAVAAVHGMDLVLTWNFTHLNNPFTRMLVRQLVENHGVRCPEICSPDELLENAHD